MTPAHFAPVPLDKSYRLLNHGPTVLVSARHGGVTDVMAAAWACVLDYGQTPRVTVVLDKATRTRELIEASGAFALQRAGTAAGASPNTAARAASEGSTQPTSCPQPGTTANGRGRGGCSTARSYAAYATPRCRRNGPCSWAAQRRSSVRS